MESPNPNLPPNLQDADNVTVGTLVDDRSPPPTLPTRSRKEQPTLTFCKAMQRVAEGARVTRVEWADENYYGFLQDSWLALHKPDKDISQWLLSDGDILADDWFELPELPLAV